MSEIAVRSLPPSVPDFLRQNASVISFVSLEPDRWRDRDQPALREANSPDHFIELEKTALLLPFPLNRYQFYQALFLQRAQLQAQGQRQRADELLPERVGLQPYATGEVYGRLVNAWRQYRRTQGARQDLLPVQQAILFYMGWLSHYVADGAQPLHTTQHSDGWVGRNPRGYSSGPGLHAKVEDAFLKVSGLESVLETTAVRPRLLNEPFSDYMTYLRASFAQVPRLYDLEKSRGFDGRGTPEGRQFIAERLSAGAEMLENFWHTAYQRGMTSP